jgi:hypothetical protein
VVVGVLPGPHANPDYFMDDAIDTFYSSPYQVHYNSNRCGPTQLNSFSGEFLLQHGCASTQHLLRWVVTKFVRQLVQMQQADRIQP